MAGLNKIQIIGNLGNDPEMRFTPQGTAVTSFNVAVNRKWTGSDGNQGEETIWFRVSAWNRLAEICNQYLTKGMQVYIEGRLKPPRVYTDRNGNHRCDPEISANTMLMLSGRGGDGGGYQDDEPEYSESRSSSGSSRPAPSGSGRNQPQPVGDEMNDDEIPF